eukprot:CAMPEP_0202962908 /NCGR_PEP_ID=MMETSP1396-20130829/6936_1 /ASSEMBLY_ACC=CAM_ASM_000872 /TAXON_ID= /ORGANISM="Pseudokeronopsis sp., Strain Brazil" /LENGTH=74 /DNA_ID=CAMNT_0049683741 /DNA_START=979 /DNA_END=1203 /DNA_ORIENTATION=-
MSKPFGFIQSYYRQEKVMEGGGGGGLLKALGGGVQKQTAERKVREVQATMLVQERAVEQKFDAVANTIAKQVGV